MVNILLIGLVLVSLFLVNLTASAPYDPWADLNDDGGIDIFDVVAVASRYSTTGDPEKNVTVTNWPETITHETTVWYGELASLTSINYSSSGFSYLHILLQILWPGPGASCEFQVRGIIWDYSHVGSRWATAYSATMVQGSRSSLSVTIPIPSETFNFKVSLISGGANIFLSYYLTNA